MIDLMRARRVLAFFAHPDDETLAAGATISKLTRAGVEVHVAIPATGIHSRRNIKADPLVRAEDLKKLRTDCVSAMSILGVPSNRLYLGEFPDNEIDKGTLLELIHWLEGIMKTFQPEIVFTHHYRCTNIDHQYCHQAAVVATRPSTSRRVSLLSAEVSSSTGYLRPSDWEPNVYIEVAKEDVENKMNAMESYHTEARAYPHPRSKEILYALSQVRGAESGFLHAESFMLIRSFG